MNYHKALATIETDKGKMTIFYNGAARPLTAENGDIVETLNCIPVSIAYARYAVSIMYSYGPWDLEWIK